MRTKTNIFQLMKRFFSIMALPLLMMSCQSDDGLFGLGIELGDSFDEVFTTLSKSAPGDVLTEYTENGREFWKEEISNYGRSCNVCFYTKPFNIGDVSFNCVYPTFNQSLNLKGVQLLIHHNKGDEGDSYISRANGGYERIISYLQTIYPPSTRIKEYDKTEDKIAYDFSTSRSITTEAFCTQRDSIVIEQSHSVNGDASNYLIAVNILRK